MKYIVFAQFVMNSYSAWEIARVLDSVIDIASEGNTVELVYCDGRCPQSCMDNVTSNSSICKMCGKYRQILYKKLPKSVNLIPLSSYASALNTDYKLIFNSIEELKQLKYKGVKIGYAAFSTYLTQTRNLAPLIDSEFIDYITSLLINCCQYTDIIEKIIDEMSPDILVCYNSRFIYSKPVIDLSNIKKIPHISLENTVNCKNEGVKVQFNTVAHNVEEITEKIDQLWNSQTKSEGEKISMAETFFYNRKHSISAGDKLYVKDQMLGLLPVNWDKNTHNIVILNSSEDEFASLGEEFENKSLFKSQYEGIKHMIDNFRDKVGCHFYLRIHPNLKDVKYKYHVSLYELFENVSNFTVIPADSPISTYALIDNCDKVIVFNSTTGPEAAYWGKPVIMLSYCAYSFLGICHKPKSISEFHEMVLNKDLSVKDKYNTLKFGYYYWNDEYPTLEHYHCHNKIIHFLKKNFKICLFEAGFSFFDRMRLVIIQIIGKKIYYENLSIPKKEATSI